jgi:peptide-methionine (S)-S-oxide reductase
MEIATFAAGCFWGVEEAFRATDGVKDVVVGYTGGTLKNPTYEDVCTGKTGHAEAVEVTFDPNIVSFAKLTETFFQNHNPTTKNRQGPDVGSQYRSAIFTHSEEQRKTAEEIRNRFDASGQFGSPIVTEIEPAGAFYKAEEYHQQYVKKHGLGSCHI